MSESKTTATAVVSCTVHVHLTQPWGGEFTLQKVQEQARESAMDLLRSKMGSGISLGDVKSVRVIMNEERV